MAWAIERTRLQLAHCTLDEWDCRSLFFLQTSFLPLLLLLLLLALLIANGQCLSGHDMQTKNDTHRQYNWRDRREKNPAKRSARPTIDETWSERKRNNVTKKSACREERQEREWKMQQQLLHQQAHLEIFCFRLNNCLTEGNTTGREDHRIEYAFHLDVFTAQGYLHATTTALSLAPAPPPLESKSQRERQRETKQLLLWVKLLTRKVRSNCCTCGESRKKETSRGRERKTVTWVKRRRAQWKLRTSAMKLIHRSQDMRMRALIVAHWGWRKAGEKKKWERKKCHRLLSSPHLCVCCACSLKMRVTRLWNTLSHSREEEEEEEEGKTASVKGW